MAPLKCLKLEFKLAADQHYINCATFSPSSRKVERAGIEAVKQVTNPHWIKPNHFFDAAQALRTDLAKVINTPEPDRIALIPASSYALAALAKNLHLAPNAAPGHEILFIENEFPNHKYALEREAAQLKLNITHVQKPEGVVVGAAWNQRILESITSKTAVVIAVQTHWVLGTLFQLEAIGARCREVGALLVIDGTQSVGAYPIDVQRIQPDLLIVAAYKWMMGPYTSGFAYFGAFFDHGAPVEESWMNRKDSNVFHKLLDHQTEYRPMAQRYNQGEFSNFTVLPMFHAATQDVLRRQPERIYAYCSALVEPFITEFERLGCQVEEAAWRSKHLFGVHLPKGVDGMQVQKELAARNVFVAIRGSAMRVSPNVYNDAADMECLVDGLRTCLG